LNTFARFFGLLVLTLTGSLASWAATPAQLLATAPVRFEPNRGQARKEALWTARGMGYAFAFTADAAVLRLGNRAVRLTFDGSNRAASFQGVEEAPGRTNYFTGSFRGSVPGFRKLRRSGVYPGVDVVYYGNGQQLEYDFEIAPGADPSRIRLKFDGADDVRLNPQGDLVLQLGSGEVTQRLPVVYQKRPSGETVAIAASYRMDNHGLVRLTLGAYRADEQLVIDPAILYTTYINGSGTDAAIAIAHDSQGFIYLAGNTNSIDFPLQGTPYQLFDNGNQDAMFVKLDPTPPGNDGQVIYGTYLGGTGQETLLGMAVDPATGLVYLTGSTASLDFPVTSGAYLASITANSHMFLSVIDPNQGTSGLIYSTYFGGTNFEEGDGIAVSGGLIYVVGTTNSTDLPTFSPNTTAAPYQTALAGDADAFVAEFDPTQSGPSSLVASTYLGGSNDDFARTIAIDANGKVYVAGRTHSFDYPIAGNAYDGTYQPGGDIFLTEIDLNAEALVYSTFLGGSNLDEADKLVLDPSGRIALTGMTLSADYPVTQNAEQPMLKGISNTFLTILDPSQPPAQALFYSTYFGGSVAEVSTGLRLDAAGKYYLSGYTISPDLPVSGNALNPTSAGGGVDGFVAVINPSADAFHSLVYSSYITSTGYQIAYDVDVDPAGVIYVTGVSNGNLFTPDQAQHTSGQGNPDVFLLIFTLP